jgi:hypothetical protein
MLAGYCGELKVTEYRSGFRLVMDQGKISAVEPWRAAEGEQAHAAFPPLVFLQVLFGYRSLAELHAFYPDCWAEDEADVVLNVLFPRAVSHVIPVG